MWKPVNVFTSPRHEIFIEQKSRKKIKRFVRSKEDMVKVTKELNK